MGKVLISDAAKVAGVHRNSINSWVKRGLLHPERHPTSRHRLFPVEELIAIRNQRDAATR